MPFRSHARGPFFVVFNLQPSTSNLASAALAMESRPVYLMVITSVTGPRFTSATVVCPMVIIGHTIHDQSIVGVVLVGVTRHSIARSKAWLGLGLPPVTVIGDMLLTPVILGPLLAMCLLGRLVARCTMPLGTCQWALPEMVVTDVF